MKIYIKYEFDLPEESEDFDIVANSYKMYIALCDMRQYLRAQVKYASEPDDIEAIYEKFHYIISDLSVEII